MTTTGRRPRPVPHGAEATPVSRGGLSMLLGSALSAQVGAAVGQHRVPGDRAGRRRRGPTVRLGDRAAGRRPARGCGPSAGSSGGPPSCSGMVFGVMNFGLYTAVDRIGLGLAVTLEFLGPLAVALATAWTVRTAAIARAGRGRRGAADRPVADDRLARRRAPGCWPPRCWAAYILLNREVGRRLPGVQGSAAAATLSALCFLPIGIVTFVHHPPTAAALWSAVAVGLLSSVVPQIADLVALRRLPRRGLRHPDERAPGVRRAGRAGRARPAPRGRPMGRDRGHHRGQHRIRAALATRSVQLRRAGRRDRPLNRHCRCPGPQWRGDSRTRSDDGGGILRDGGFSDLVSDWFGRLVRRTRPPPSSAPGRRSATATTPWWSRRPAPARPWPRSCPRSTSWWWPRPRPRCPPRRAAVPAARSPSPSGRRPPPAAAGRCRVLYLSPLKALAVDVERNLRAPLTGIAVQAAAARPAGAGDHGRGPLRRHPDRGAAGSSARTAPTS